MNPKYFQHPNKDEYNKLKPAIKDRIEEFIKLLIVDSKDIFHEEPNNLTYSIGYQKDKEIITDEHAYIDIKIKRKYLPNKLLVRLKIVRINGQISKLFEQVKHKYVTKLKHNLISFEVEGTKFKLDLVNHRSNLNIYCNETMKGELDLKFVNKIK